MENEFNDEVVAEQNGETATARRTARAQLSRNVEDGVMWRRNVAGYGRRRVAAEPSLCEQWLQREFKVGGQGLNLGGSRRISDPTPPI